MTSSRFWALLLVIGVVLVATATLAGGTTTHAAFVDDELGNGSVTAAASFDRGPPGPRAYSDANGNGQWDPSETTYTESQLYSFDDSSAALVVPSDVGTVNNSGGIDITAGSITAQTDFQSNSGSVSLAATDGDADLRGQQVLSAGTTSVTATGTTNLNGSQVFGLFSSQISGKSVSARGANVASFVSVTLSAREDGGGTLDATSASVTSVYGDITLLSSGAMRIESAGLSAQNGDVTADLRRGGRTLFVDGASITDSDDTLIYGLRGTTVDGTPAAGSVSARSGRGGGRPNTAARGFSSGATTIPDESSPELPEPPIDWEALGERLGISLSNN